VYADHAFVVSEAPGHGMQVFDLSELRQVISPPVTFSETAYFDGFGSAQNIVINEDSGYAYGVGTNTCSGGLHFVDISNPTSPTGDGCFSGDGYTHDAQCVIYNGPDANHQGEEICVNANEETVTIVDVTNKANPIQLSRTGYPNAEYTHQGWLSEDHRYYFKTTSLMSGTTGTIPGRGYGMYRT
jgi:choice-of-anchor B domain-containing protein